MILRGYRRAQLVHNFVYRVTHRNCKHNEIDLAPSGIDGGSMSAVPRSLRVAHVSTVQG